MVNCRAKGFANERKAEKILEEEGWTVQRVKGSTKFAKNVDFFGLWDILAIRHPIEEISPTIYWTLDNTLPEEIKKFKKRLGMIKNDYQLINTNTIPPCLEIKFVQVKSNRKPKLDEYKKFADKHRGVNASFEVWVFKDYKGVEKYEC